MQLPDRSAILAVTYARKVTDLVSVYPRGGRFTARSTDNFRHMALDVIGEPGNRVSGDMETA